MTQIYYAGSADAWEGYRVALPEALAELDVDATLSNTCEDPAAVDYIVYSPSGPVKDFTPFTNTRAVLSLWAGVEKIVGNASLTQPLCRMVDPGLSEGMTEWVTGHVLRYHLGTDVHVTLVMMGLRRCLERLRSWCSCCHKPPLRRA